MGSLSRKIRRAAEKEAAKTERQRRVVLADSLLSSRHKLPDAALSGPFFDSVSMSSRPPRGATHMGIYCDCYGTLYSFNFKRAELLVDYLNAQHAAGKHVQLISTHVDQSFPHISDIGLHKDIVASLTAKAPYRGNHVVLETLIDDDPVGLTAITLHDPKDDAFREHMRTFLERHPAPTLSP